MQILYLIDDSVTDLYLLPFGPLRPQFRGGELNDWMSFMFEKGLRIRKDIAPYLVNWKEEEREDTPAANDELDEVERRAAEYRRLLPYN